MQISWTMNIKQNVRSHTRIIPDKFSTNKIQKGRQSAILIVFFSLSLKSSMRADLLINFCFLILHIAITYRWGIFRDILISIIMKIFNLLGPLTKKYSSARFTIFFPADLIIWQICTAMSNKDLLNSWEQTIFK